MDYCAFAKETSRPPRSLASQIFTNIRRWPEMSKGGHFTAMVQPEALAGEIQAFRPPPTLIASQHAFRRPNYARCAPP